MSPQDEFQSLQEQLRRSQPDAPQAPPVFKRELRRQLLEKHDMRSRTAIHLMQRFAWAAAILIALPVLYLAWSRTGLGLPPPEPEFTAGGPGPAAAVTAVPLEPTPGAPAPVPEDGAPVWIEAVGAPQPFDASQSEVTFSIGYELDDFAGGYVTLSFGVDRADEGSSGGITAYVAAGESPLRLPVTLDNSWFDETGALSDDVQLSLALEGMLEGGAAVPIYPPAAFPDPGISPELSINTLSYGRSAADQPALVVSLFYQRQVASPASLRVTVSGGDAGQLASQEITVTSRAEGLDLALPLALSELPADLLLQVSAALDADPEPITDMISLQAGSLLSGQERPLWLDGWYIETGGSPEDPPQLALRLGYNIDESFDHGSLAFDYQYKLGIAAGGSGGGAGGGEQMLPVGQGVHQMRIMLAVPVDFIEGTSWPAGLTVELTLKGVGEDLIEEPLGMLSLPCPAFDDLPGLCQE